MCFYGVDLLARLSARLSSGLQSLSTQPDRRKSGYIGTILGLYWDNGQSNGSYHLGFRVQDELGLRRLPVFVCESL